MARWNPSWESLLYTLYDNRYEISGILVVLLLIYLIKNRRSFVYYDAYYDEDSNQFTTEEDSYNSLEAFILALEETRKVRGFKPGWLYYRCAELGLDEVLNSLRASGQIPYPKQSFNDEQDRQRRPEPEPSDPYEILGLQRSANQDQIKQAYRDMMKLYHPDRVHGLGKELQELAQRKTTAINSAYEKLTTSN